MASAHVAGVAARLFARHPDATPSQVEAAIVRSARPVAKQFAHRCRHGIVDMAAARAWLDRGTCLRRPPGPPIRWADEPRCDDRMRRRLELRIFGDEVDAIVMLRAGVPGGPALVERVERHARACRRRHHHLRLLPDGRNAVLVGHYRLLRRLLRDPAVAYLHSTELDVLGWSPAG